MFVEIRARTASTEQQQLMAASVPKSHTLDRSQHKSPDTYSWLLLPPPCFFFWRCILRVCTLLLWSCVVQNFDDVKTLFMQSDGGLTPVASFRGSRAILSGPAGGVVGYAATSYGDGDAGGRGGEKPAVIGFDMGGTSTGEREPT